ARRGNRTTGSNVVAWQVGSLSIRSDTVRESLSADDAPGGRAHWGAGRTKQCHVPSWLWPSQYGRSSAAEGEKEPDMLTRMLNRRTGAGFIVLAMTLAGGGTMGGGGEGRSGPRCGRAVLLRGCAAGDRAAGDRAPGSGAAGTCPGGAPSCGSRAGGGSGTGGSGATAVAVHSNWTATGQSNAGCN